MQDSSTNHFALFGLPAAFAIDTALLDQRYRQLQSEVHPDKFAAASSTEKLRSMQWATSANEAYRTLKNPTARARYLLELQGIHTDEESNTAMPTDFLMQQMEWREAIEEARDAKDLDALDNLLKDIQAAAKSLQQDLEQQLGAESAELTAAAGSVRKLSFVDKLREDILQSMEKLEA
ncbi:Fe-S protein assembly co-chaperone HscB [Methylovorus glucosotrophus]|nr:Fe-S protein assembly co-chaperone HscB [Methylovorus glucosotrophus]